MKHPDSNKSSSKKRAPEAHRDHAAPKKPPEEKAVAHPAKAGEEPKKTSAPHHSKPEKTSVPSSSVSKLKPEPEKPENICNIDVYSVSADNVPAQVSIYKTPEEYVPTYHLTYSKIPPATHAMLNSIREELLSLVSITTKEFVDPSAIVHVKAKFAAKAKELIERYLPGISEADKSLLVGSLIHDMLGMGPVELMLADNQLEEVVVNNSKQPVWVYHKRHGWLKTDLVLPTEEQIYNYSSAIGRHVGRQITNLYPLMDAHLSTGDRVNATLFPISTQGNTITIRKFARSPWTIINMIDPKVKTISAEVAAFLWLAIQYELNILIVGGTASGKTSFLNTLMPFMPPNQRIISIEDTREINLPKFLHWVPFSSREPNAEGKGGISMLDLLTNSLRMRPDRIIVGEVRRSQEVEVMFEAIRTGHSAYATFHADRSDQAYKRLINPPINLPESMLSALHLIVVQYRQRRIGVRRTLEVAEIIPLEATENRLNVIYRWNPKTDNLEICNKIFRVFSEIGLYTGMSEDEIRENLRDREAVLNWMLAKNIKTVDAVGKVMAEYYKNENAVVSAAKRNADPREILGSMADEIKEES